MRDKAQATLEFTLIFVIMVALLAGLLGLWKWSSDNIIRRQLNYNATRVAEGSTPSSSAPLQLPVPPEYTIEVNNAMAGPNVPADSLSLLSSQQINDNLDNLNKLISDTQANLATLTGFRDTWQSDFEMAQQEEAKAQAEVDRLNADIAAKQRQLETANCCGAAGGWAWWGCVDCSGFQQAIIADQAELAKATNGYYTIWNWGDGWFWIFFTYDSSNQKWMDVFNTREAWAKDYWTLQQYGVSEGNNQYGLYTNYTAGLLDWQARKAYAQEQLVKYQKNVDDTTSALAQAEALRDKLLAAKASKT
ncbi:MAG: hypothetical protein COT38_01050 [Candidatus Omnitrophica bacterium CG08_land_8_20_14_0_20_41_16]|nr:MAG: hypothetical protein COT38_01050 [Candidatus Omnitrophica bacterium CG08_land_8_20_14_0_20_41_16]